MNQISAFWFERTKDIVSNHLVSTAVESFPQPLPQYARELQGRSSLVKRCEPLPIECVVRGYLAGSGWKDYQQTGGVCGIQLPKNLRESDRLPRSIFTPATKAQEGHDINISFDEAVEIVGRDVADQVRRFSLALYKWGSAYARERGIIICDTKFEFGRIGSELFLIDEVLTRTRPASGRRTSTLRERRNLPLTNSSYATIWRRWTGTRRLRDRTCPQRSSRPLPNGTSRPSAC